jgi:hypothetical protein
MEPSNNGEFETMAANLLTETLIIRDKVINFPDGFLLTLHELNEITNYIRTC